MHIDYEEALSMFGDRNRSCTLTRVVRPRAGRKAPLILGVLLLCPVSVHGQVEGLVGTGAAGLTGLRSISMNAEATLAVFVSVDAGLSESFIALPRSCILCNRRTDANLGRRWKQSRKTLQRDIGDCNPSCWGHGSYWLHRWRRN
jgi:hypothetical protein